MAIEFPWGKADSLIDFRYQGTVSRCWGLPFTQVNNIGLGCCALGSFTTVCGSQGRLYMHSADPVELHWPWKAPWGRGQVNVCNYNYVSIHNNHVLLIIVCILCRGIPPFLVRGRKHCIFLVIFIIFFILFNCTFNIYYTPSFIVQSGSKVFTSIALCNIEIQ